MARPTKNCTVNKIPHCKTFCCNDNSPQIEIALTIEEYEVIRLIDYLGYNQNDAAKQMEVSRATIQALYQEARKKLARFLIEGANLNIQGGNYEIKSQENKGEMKMKIAVTYENGLVFQHFGHTKTFKVYDVEDGKIIKSEVIDTNGQGHGALAGFLKNNEIAVLICGGIGGGARNALSEAGIELYPGASGNADDQVNSLLQGKLQYDPNTSCNHHSHEAGHSCGNHGCHHD